MPVLDRIEKFKTEYMKIINGFAIIDEHDPITSLKLSTLQEVLNLWVETLIESFSKDKKYEAEFLKRTQGFLNKYQQKIKILNDSFNKNIKSITKDHIEACQRLKQRIEVTKKDTLYNVEQLEVECDYFFATSEQNKIILTNDFLDAKKRFDYQRDEAKESYLEIIQKNNRLLDQIKEKLYADYDQELQLLLTSQTEEMEKLKHYVEIQENELSSMNIALENEKSNMKEKYRQESANLNENVKKISDEKNKLIDNARNQYNKSMNDANIEKENKKAIYQAKAQALLKEFVTKINVIDENTSIIKKEFDKKINQIKRDYYSDIFKKTQEFHHQLEQILLSSSGNIDKYTNHLIRYKNKQHQLKVNLSKKERELILLELTKDNTVKVLSNRNDKNYLEIDKNFAIKNITDQEQFDNKYYQETSNIYENDFNYTVKTANYRFSQKANILRCQSQIHTKLLERNFDGISANYYKKIETIQNKINSYRVLIDYTSRLNRTVVDYLNSTYQNHLHLEETNNLLEIEKNKILKEYNLSQYEYNVKNITLAKEYGFKKIDLENQKAEENKKLKVTLENLILERNSVSTAFSIKREELNERFAKIKTQLINNNDLRVSKEDYISNLQNSDIAYLDQYIGLYTSFFEDFNMNYLKVITILLEDLVLDEENYHFIESLINSFLSLFLDLLNELLEDLEEKIVDVLDKKMDYIYQFKYKTSLDSLEDEHLKSVTEIKEQKNEILDKVDSSNKTIENFRQKIFTLINDNEMLIHNSQLRKKRLDPSILASIKQTELKIKDYKEKIDDFTKMNRMHSDDLQELNQQLAANNRLYKEELSKIHKMMKKDIHIYLLYKDKVESLFEFISLKIKEYRGKGMLHSSTSKNLKKNLANSHNGLNKILSISRNHILKEFVTFKRNSDKDIAYKMACCTNEYKTEIKKYNVQYNKATEEYQEEYRNTITSYENRIEEHRNLLNQTMADFDFRLEKAHQDFKNDSNDLDALHQQITRDFFNSYYALSDNHQKIIDYHFTMSNHKKEQFAEDKNNLAKQNEHQQELLNSKLKHFLKTKNEEIEHLPIAFKYNSKILNKETKKKNIQLHEDIKEAKNTYNIENRQIERNIRSLKAHLVQDKFNNEYQQKKNIIHEKKNNLINLKQSLRSIKIEL